MRRAADKVGIDPRAMLGVVVLVAGTFVWLLAFSGVLSGITKRSSASVKAHFSDVQAIVPRDPVRIKGVKVGQVDKVEPDSQGRGGTITMKLTTSDKIYRDASADIVSRTVLGAVNAIRLHPGTASKGGLGDTTIPVSRTSNQVELDQVTRSFRGGAKQGTRTTLKELGPAFADHPALGRTLVALGDVAPGVQKGVGAVRGQIVDEDLERLVNRTAKATRALSVGTDAGTTRRFVSSAAQTVSATGANPAALQASIDNFDRVSTTGMQRIYRQYDGVLTKLDPVVHKLNGSAGQLAPTVRDLRPALTHTNQVLRAAKPLLREVDPAVQGIAGSAKAGVPIIRKLKPAFKNLNGTALPGLYQKYPQGGGRPVYQFIGGPLTTFGALTSYFDSNGQIANLAAGLEDPQGAQALPCHTDFTGENFLVCQSLSDALQTYLSGGSGTVRKMTRRAGGEKYRGMLRRTLALEKRAEQNRAKLKQKDPVAERALFGKRGGKP